jgi:predicted RNA binding protein YcfA (HicA-like mRNA interferase family)
MPKLPGIRHKDAIRVLEKAGWRVIREGKHTIMGKGNAAIPVPRHNPVDALTMGYCEGSWADPGTISGDAVSERFRALVEKLTATPTVPVARTRHQRGEFLGLKAIHRQTALNCGQDFVERRARPQSG